MARTGAYGSNIPECVTPALDNRIWLKGKRTSGRKLERGIERIRRKMCRDEIYKD